jgi:outer membrane beta-barrel protein
MNTHTTAHPARAAAPIVLIAAVAAASFIAAPAFAQGQTPSPGQATKPANEQVVVPQVDRREVQPPTFPSNDFEVGAFIGTYAAQNFGSSVVYGLRVGYAITEDVFVQASYGSTQVSDDLFRQILPGGIFAGDTERLSYYNLSVGYNVLPGEVFIGAKRALASALYVLGGIGSTNFNDQTRQTINIGLGARVFLKDSFSLQVDVRDYIYSLDLLGKSENTQNLELTFGFSFFF